MKELEEHLPIIVNYRYYLIEDEAALAEYIADEKNFLMTRLKPAMEPVKHKPPYIKHCLQELKNLQSEIKSHDTGIGERIESFDRDIREHIWVTDDFAEPASRGLQQARADARKLLACLEKLIEGYGKLPQEEEDTGSATYYERLPAEADRAIAQFSPTRKPPPK